MRDGVYADATRREDGNAYIGIVYVSNGSVKERFRTKYPDCPTSGAAEAAAIQLAQDLFPTEVVYSDCAPVAERFGAFWIPREENRDAHAEANKAAKDGVEIPVAAGGKKKKSKAVKRRKQMGRGCVPASEKRMVFV